MFHEVYDVRKTSPKKTKYRDEIICFNTKYDLLCIKCSDKNVWMDQNIQESEKCSLMLVLTSNTLKLLLICCVTLILHLQYADVY